LAKGNPYLCVLLGCLAACARHEETTSATDAAIASASATATASASATPSATATTDATAPADATTDAPADAKPATDAGTPDFRAGESLGPVKLGVSKDAVVAALGKPDSSTAHDGREMLRYFGGGLQVSLEAGKVKGIFAYSGVAGGYEKASKRYDVRGPSGITMDSTADQIVQSLGPADARGELSHAPIPSRWLAYDSGLSFEFVKSTGKLVSITVLPKKK
jgi:hypothetical protein